MASRLILALAAIAAVTASPIPDEIRAINFCSSWSPLGTDYLSGEAPYDFECRPSRDGRSLTMRIIGKTGEDTYTYLMMSVVDKSGVGMAEGDYKIDHRLRTLRCVDKSTRVLKVTEDKINDIIATYTLPEDKEVTLEDVNCRFAVATDLVSYYRDVTVSPLGETVETVDEPIVGEETTEQVVEEVETVDNTDLPIAGEEINDQTGDETEVFNTTANVDTTVNVDTTAEFDTNAEFDTTANVDTTAEFDTTANVDTTADFNTTADVDTTGEFTTPLETSRSTNETFVEPTVAPVEEVIPEETETDETLTEFTPTNTVDERETLDRQFETEEDTGRETPVQENKDETIPVIAPGVPETTDEFKNEGEVEEEEPEYMVDEFGIKRMIIPEKEKKLIYKGTPTGYWCEDMGNTYVMAPGTDCRMFYQTVMKEETSVEVLPLAAFNCAPGTRFNTFKCTCSQYDGMVCPEADPNFKTTTLKPEASPVFNETTTEDF